MWQQEGKLTKIELTHLIEQNSDPFDNFLGKHFNTKFFLIIWIIKLVPNSVSVYFCPQIDLSTFMSVAAEEIAKKDQTFDTNNMHNLMNVFRSRSEMGVFSDYPHFYELKAEGQQQSHLFGTRAAENGDFIISNRKDVFCLYGQNFMGILKANMLGTRFDLFDYGLEARFTKELPKGFLPKQRLVQTIEYDSNFFAEKPRSFRITLYDLSQKEQVVLSRFENLQPKFNAARGCYTLNFFGRV